MGTGVGKNPTPWAWSCPVPARSPPVLQPPSPPPPRAPYHISLSFFFKERSSVKLVILLFIYLRVYCLSPHQDLRTNSPLGLLYMVPLLGPVASTGWGLNRFVLNE